MPGRELRRLAEDERTGGPLDPYQALRLADLFRVSYATMLGRLREERLIDPGTYREWRTYSPSAMARAIGLDPEAYRLPEPRRDEQRGPSLERYPASVLERVKRALDDRRLSVAAAAELLDVEVEALRKLLAIPGKARRQEVQELDELPF